MMETHDVPHDVAAGFNLFLQARAEPDADLLWAVKEPWTFLVTKHLRERQYREDSAPERTATFLALGRYELILERARAEIAGKFSVDDLLFLLDACAGSLHDPGGSELHATGLAEHWGWEQWEDAPVRVRPLLRKLNGLTCAQSVALADVLERVWHCVPNADARSYETLIAAAGLKLSA